jgi:hypothetical protein
MKPRTFALFAFWTTLAGVLAFLPSWACLLGSTSGRWPLAPTNIALLVAAFAIVVVQQVLTSRVAAMVAGWFSSLEHSLLARPQRHAEHRVRAAAR